MDSKKFPYRLIPSKGFGLHTTEETRRETARRYWEGKRWNIRSYLAARWPLDPGDREEGKVGRGQRSDGIQKMLTTGTRSPRCQSTVSNTNHVDLALLS